MMTASADMVILLRAHSPDIVTVGMGLYGRRSYLVQLKTAGLGSVKPLLSTARTRNVCVPRLTAAYVTGLMHEVKAAPSSRHSNRATVPLSVPANRNVTLSEGVLSPFVSDLPRPSTAPLIVV